MKKIISGIVLLSVASAFAAGREEEGVVLNQELEFLKEAARAPRLPADQAASQNIETKSAAPSRLRSLEATYFGDEEEDSVSTRTAARRRRGSEE
jgi:hypothetical protein